MEYNCAVITVYVKVNISLQFLLYNQLSELFPRYFENIRNLGSLVYVNSEIFNRMTDVLLIDSFI
jgi:hypothetical protein